MEVFVMIVIASLAVYLAVAYRSRRTRDGIIGTYAGDRTLRAAQCQGDRGVPPEYVGGRVRIIHPDSEDPT